jgi:hypothetical protein
LANISTSVALLVILGGLQERVPKWLSGGQKKKVTEEKGRDKATSPAGLEVGSELPTGHVRFAEDVPMNGRNGDTRSNGNSFRATGGGGGISRARSKEFIDIENWSDFDSDYDGSDVDDDGDRNGNRAADYNAYESSNDFNADWGIEDQISNRNMRSEGGDE